MYFKSSSSSRLSHGCVPWVQAAALSRAVQHRGAVCGISREDLPLVSGLFKEHMVPLTLLLGTALPERGGRAARVL